MQVINSFHEFHRLIQPKALIFFDIDDVLINRRHLLTDPYLSTLLHLLYNAECMIQGLTARKINDKNINKTLEVLNTNQIYFNDFEISFSSELPVAYKNGIIFAPHTEENISQKGLALVAFLEQITHISSQFSQIVFIDNSNLEIIAVENQKNIIENLMQCPLVTFHLQSVQLLSSDLFCHNAADISFAPKLDRLDYIDSIRGTAGGGVHILQDRETKARYTLKIAHDEDNLKNEILTASLLKAHGVLVPPFKVYAHFPKPLFNQLSERCESFGDKSLYLVSQWINEGGDVHTADYKAAKKYQAQIALRPFLPLFTLLCYRDAHLKNLVCDNEQRIWCVDSGCALTFTGHGDHNTHIAIQNINIDLHNSGYLLPDEELVFKNQLQSTLTGSFLSNVNDVITLVHQKLTLTNVRNYFHFIQERMRAIQEYFTGIPQPVIHSAGIAFSLETVEETSLLIGKRRGNGHYCTPGGKIDINNDNYNIFHTALREVIEELEASFFQGMRYDYSRFIDYEGHRLFFVQLNQHQSNALKQALNSINARCNEKTEMSDFRLISYRQLMGAVERDSSVIDIAQDVSITLFQPFWSLLKLFFQRDKSLQSIYTAPPNLEDFQLYAIRHRLVMPEIAKKYLEKESGFDEGAVQCVDDAVSPSELHIKLKCSEHGKCTEELIKNYLATRALPKEIHLPRVHQQVLKMIEIEKRNPNHLFVYHAVNRDVAFLYQFLQGVSRFINGQSYPPIFRLEEDKFNGYQNFKDMFNHFVSAYGMPKEGHNYHEHFASLCIAGNGLLFGCEGVIGSDSFQLYLTNTAHHPRDLETPKKMFEKIFFELGLPKALRRMLLSLYEETIGSLSSSTLYQMILSPSQENKLNVCKQLGVQFDESYTLSQIYKELANGALSCPNFQLRWLSIPGNACVVHSYELEETDKQSKEKLEVLIHDLIGPWYLTNGCLGIHSKFHPILRTRQSIFSEGVSSNHIYKQLIIAAKTDRWRLASHYLKQLYPKLTEQQFTEYLITDNELLKICALLMHKRLVSPTLGKKITYHITQYAQEMDYGVLFQICYYFNFQQYDFIDIFWSISEKEYSTSFYVLGTQWFEHQVKHRHTPFVEGDHRFRMLENLLKIECQLESDAIVSYLLDNLDRFVSPQSLAILLNAVDNFSDINKCRITNQILAVCNDWLLNCGRIDNFIFALPKFFREQTELKQQVLNHCKQQENLNRHQMRMCLHIFADNELDRKTEEVFFSKIIRHFERGMFTENYCDAYVLLRYYSGTNPAFIFSNLEYSINSLNHMFEPTAHKIYFIYAVLSLYEGGNVGYLRANLLRKTLKLFSEGIFPKTIDTIQLLMLIAEQPIKQAVAHYIFYYIQTMLISLSDVSLLIHGVAQFDDLYKISCDMITEKLRLDDASFQNLLTLPLNFSVLNKLYWINPNQIKINADEYKPPQLSRKELLNILDRLFPQRLKPERKTDLSIVETKNEACNLGTTSA